MYFIKKGYRENPGPVYFVDDVHEREDPIVFQPDVLPYAAELAEQWALMKDTRPKIIDVGCGQALKLEKIHDEHPDWEFVGVDYGENLEWCRKRFDWGEWIEMDLEQDQELDATDAVVVASDIIEHLVDPTPMLRTFKESDAAYVVISTPERDLQYGTEHMGPSTNKCHVREWNQAELTKFLENEGFTVAEMGTTRGNDRGDAKTTILAVAIP